MAAVYKRAALKLLSLALLFALLSPIIGVGLYFLFVEN